MKLEMELIKLLKKKAPIDKLKVEKAVIGVFYAGVKLNNGSGGVALHHVTETTQSVCCPKIHYSFPDAGQMSGTPLKKILNFLKGNNLLQRAVGIAAANAVSSQLIFSGKYKVHENCEASQLIEFRKSDIVVMIGAFTPYISNLPRRVRELHVVERRKTRVCGDKVHLHPESKAKNVLKKADVVLITGSALVNGTMEELITYSSGAREIAVIGPTASILPDPLFHGHHAELQP